jgi:hypothetical protein
MPDPSQVPEQRLPQDRSVSAGVKTGSQEKGSATEAALLWWLGVKRDLAGLHLLHQFLEPINRKLVVNRPGYALAMLDLFVEFQALVAHWKFRIRAKSRT